jgi:hypothetical protein
MPLLAGATVQVGCVSDKQGRMHDHMPLERSLFVVEGDVHVKVNETSSSLSVDRTLVYLWVIPIRGCSSCNERRAQVLVLPYISTTSISLSSGLCDLMKLGGRLGGCQHPWPRFGAYFEGSDFPPGFR